MDNAWLAILVSLGFIAVVVVGLAICQAYDDHKDEEQQCHT